MIGVKYESCERCGKVFFLNVNSDCSLCKDCQGLDQLDKVASVRDYRVEDFKKSLENILVEYLLICNFQKYGEQKFKNVLKYCIKKELIEPDTPVEDFSLVLFDEGWYLKFYFRKDSLISPTMKIKKNTVWIEYLCNWYKSCQIEFQVDTWDDDDIVDILFEGDYIIFDNGDIKLTQHLGDDYEPDFS